MGGCCGKGPKSFIKKREQHMPLEFHTPEKARNDRCFLCGGQGKKDRKWDSGVKRRVFVCAAGHVSPA